MGFVTADEVAEVFDIAERIGAVVEAARGWGGHNVVYRLDTTAGRWAVKALGRDLNELYRESFAIEMAAFEGGSACPGRCRLRTGIPTRGSGVGGCAAMSGWRGGLAERRTQPARSPRGPGPRGAPQTTQVGWWWWAAVHDSSQACRRRYQAGESI
jgi:hypothetical protein